MGRYFGREPRLSRQELELEAQQAIDARVDMGRPPAEDWAPIEARLVQLDREMAARSAPPPVPLAPLLRQARPVTGPHQEIALTEVRLPAGAKAGTAPPTDTRSAGFQVARRPVGAEER